MNHTDVGLSEEALDNAAPEFADDSFYQALAHPTRRRLLFALLDTPTGTVDDLAELLYGWAATAGEEADYERTRTALHHTHLPKLDAAGLVEFDRETGAVERTDVHEGVRTLVRQGIAAELRQREV